MTLPADASPAEGSFPRSVPSVAIRQPPPAEYLLKGLSPRVTGTFMQALDLHHVYEVTDAKTRVAMAGLGASMDGFDLPEFLEKRRNDFFDLRYPPEGVFGRSDPAGFLERR